MSHGDVCRTCAGDGLGLDLPVRRAQILQTCALTLTADHKQPRVLAISREARKVKGGGKIYLYRPLAELVQLLDELLHEGFAVEAHSALPEDVLREATPCDSCHGKGTPGLSVLTMELALAATPTEGAA